CPAVSTRDRGARRVHRRCARRTHLPPDLQPRAAREGRRVNALSTRVVVNTTRRYVGCTPSCFGRSPDADDVGAVNDPRRAERLVGVSRELESLSCFGLSRDGREEGAERLRYEFLRETRGFVKARYGIGLRDRDAFERHRAYERIGVDPLALDRDAKVECAAIDVPRRTLSDALVIDESLDDHSWPPRLMLTAGRPMWSV